MDLPAVVRTLEHATDEGSRGDTDIDTDINGVIEGKHFQLFTSS
jgi:hypothetical protein